MGRKAIITENSICRIVRETVRQILREGYEGDSNYDFGKTYDMDDFTFVKHIELKDLVDVIDLENSSDKELIDAIMAYGDNKKTPWDFNSQGCDGVITYGNFAIGEYQSNMGDADFDLYIKKGTD